MASTDSPSPFTYPVSIPSIWDKHNHLTRKHGFVDLDQAICAGDEVNENELNKAWALVKYLEAIAELEVDPTITKAVITTAKVRAKAIDQAIINAHCGVVQTSSVASQDERSPQLHELDGSDLNLSPVGSTPTSHMNAPQPQKVSGKRQQGDLNVQEKFKEILAKNLEIRSENTLRRGVLVPVSDSKDLDPIEKTVPGNGLSLVYKLNPTVGLRCNKIHADLIQFHAEAYVRAEVGSTPPSFRQNPSYWTVNYILTLVYFYNMDFGLKQGESAAVWLRKVEQAFLLD